MNPEAALPFRGGEPLMQPDFLLALLQTCRKEDLHTAVDTSGYAAWQVFERIIPFVNLFLFDLKSMDDDIHRRYTGVSNRLILDNLHQLASLKRSIILRLPIVPGINDHESNLRAAAQLAASLPAIEHIDLLAYHNSATSKYEGLGLEYRLPEVTSPAPERMEEIADLFRSYGLIVHIGG